MTHHSDDKLNCCIYLPLVMLYSMKTVLFLKYAVYRHILLCCAVKVYLKYTALWSYSEDEGSGFYYHNSPMRLHTFISQKRAFSWWLQ